jgi:hypothetical protein
MIEALDIQNFIEKNTKVRSLLIVPNGSNALAVEINKRKMDSLDLLILFTQFIAVTDFPEAMKNDKNALTHAINFNIELGVEGFKQKLLKALEDYPTGETL